MRKPWLPPLPELLGVDDLALAAGDVATGGIPPIPFGRADLPRDQRQVVETWDMVSGSHLMIAGQSRSGRSNCLRVLAGGIARLCSPEDVHLYGIDAGNNALLPLMALPHVGAVVTRTQTDRMYRLVAFLQKELASRQQSLAERGFADIGEQRAGVAAEERLPYLVVLLDRWEGFIQAFESLDGGVLLDRITALLQEGAGVGIRMVMTADRTGLVGRISTLIEDRIALSMSDPGDFSNIGIPVREVPAVMPPGRAFRAGERPREVQWGLLDVSGAGTDQVRVLQEIGREATERYVDLPRSRRPQRIDDLPATIGVREARQMEPALIAERFVPVGVGGDSLALQGFDPEVGGNGFLITGPPRSGKSNTLQFVLSGVRRRPTTLFLPRRSPLLTDPPRGAKVFTGTEPIEEVRNHLDKLRGDHVIAVDDFEVIGTDTPLGQLLTRAVRQDARLRQPDVHHRRHRRHAQRLPRAAQRDEARPQRPGALTAGDQRRRRPQRPAPPVRLGRDAGRPRRAHQPARLDLGPGPPDVSRMRDPGHEPNHPQPHSVGWLEVCGGYWVSGVRTPARGAGAGRLPWHPRPSCCAGRRRRCRPWPAPGRAWSARA